MKLAYKLVSSGLVLDTVTVTDSRISYDTGKAKSLFDSKVRIMGRKLAIATLTNWSNGYVSVTPIE